MIVKIGNHGRTGEGRIRIESLISKGHGSDGTKKKEGFLLEFFFDILNKKNTKYNKGEVGEERIQKIIN